MKITDVCSYVLKSPLGDQGFYASQESFSERSSCLVRIETDSGLVGWGEARPVGRHGERYTVPQTSRLGGAGWHGSRAKRRT